MNEEGKVTTTAEDRKMDTCDDGADEWKSQKFDFSWQRREEISVTS